MDLKETSEGFSRLLLHPAFEKTISEINELDIKIPFKSEPGEMDFELFPYPVNGRLVSNVEKGKKYKLNPKNGQKFLSNGTPICAYDESFHKFPGLEGTGYLFSHSLVLLGKEDYIPSCFLALYFLTRSKSYAKKASYIKHSIDPESDSKRLYVNDRTEFIIQNVPKNSILLIDGALIGGQISHYTVKMNQELLKKNVIPLFFVKNSNSNLVTKHTKNLKWKYNSDMDWSYRSLKVGERTCFFNYQDRHKKINAKLFCYLKAFNLSPQRVELHVSTYEKYRGQINDLMDLVYYLVLVQGDYKNPQVRPIAIAEKFAREAKKLVDLSQIMIELGATPTMNQIRFG